MQEIYVEDGNAVDPDLVNDVSAFIVDLFGPPHDETVLHEVRFYDERQPMTAYIDHDNPYCVSIFLPIHQADQPAICAVHLAHELVHCLTPNGPPGHKATMLEEGLANFAMTIVASRCLPDVDLRGSLSGKYIEALQLVEELIEVEAMPAVLQGIKMMRMDTGMPFCDLGSQDLRTYFKRAPTHLLERLSCPFHDQES